MSYIVLDTNILVSALWSDLMEGKPAKLLDLCLAGRHQAVCTHAILEEYAAVLTRPKFGFPAQDISALLDFFRFKALNADPLFGSLSRPTCTDRDDQKFYDTACCCDALLITGNKRHYPQDPRVTTPAEFLSRWR